MKNSTLPTKQENNAVATRENTRTLTPPVDIFDAGDALVVVADLPGVDQEHIDINIEKNVLTLKAEPSTRVSEPRLLNEFALYPFYRQFQLGEMVDQEKVRAELRYGVLTVYLPKVAEKQPKKIEVKVG
ncbi:MAG TPA: Hsp20/alpha crystallin family protein [Candidatus Hydrogenedentes bacterium]|nr:Hsp20/alpha crystallin family protein [Candidatus Hydrogenedentota bacterium]HPU97385.1 Hsp20/alpha crystallin family protein [Candidatus Hydrogenedentota bacterium]